MDNQSRTMDDRDEWQERVREICTSGTPLLLLLLLFYSLKVFPYQRELMVFNWSLSDSKSPQESRTLLSILIDLINAIVWIFSTRTVISKSSSPCTNPLVTVSKAPITIGIIVTFMFDSFFIIIIIHSLELFTSALANGFSLESESLQDSSRDSKVDNFASSLFFVDYYKVWSSGRD